MVLDGLRGYLQLANGLTEVTRARARATARSLVAQGEAGVEAVLPAPVRVQVAAVTEDLMATSKANRDLLLNLVRGEVERSVARLGLVSALELDAAARRAKGLERRVSELEEELRRSSTARKAAATRTARSTAKKSTAKKSTAKRTTGRKSTAKKSTAKKSTAKKSTAKKSTAKKSTAKKATAKKSTAKKSTAKKAPAKKAPAKKAPAKKATAKKTATKTTT
jgi:DNA-binding protein HU-beta